MNDALPDANPLARAAAFPQALLMSVSRKIEYVVEQTPLPIFDPLNDALANAVAGLPTVIVVDEKVWDTYGPALEHYVCTKLDSLSIVRLAATEATKTFDAIAALCKTAFDVKLPRHGAFIAVGGGTLLDAVGFAASIFRRGVAYVRVPTTLIGIIDVGVGIKQAINFQHKKNSIGSFYPPLRTINDIRFLRRLPRRELACGLAEALKMGLVCDRVLFETIERHAAELIASGFRTPPSAAIDILVRAQVSMMEQLSSNLYEADLRRLVDFGHSFSPTIESASDYAVPHGEAVGLDMLLSTAIAAGRGLCEADLVPRLRRLYATIGLPVMHATLSPLLMERALVDVRAHRGGALNFVVPTALGCAEFIQDIAYDEIVSALQLIYAAA